MTRVLHVPRRLMQTLVFFVASCCVMGSVTVSALAEDDLIEGTNSIFEIIREDIADSPNPLESIHFINEYTALQFSATILAYMDLSNSSVEEILSALEEQGTITVTEGSSHQSTTYLASIQSVPVIDFKSLKELFPSSGSLPGIQQQAELNYYKLIKAYTYREVLLDQNGSEVLSLSDLSFPLRISWWRDIVTSEYGVRDLEEINMKLGDKFESTNHTGLDIGCGMRTEVYSAGSGTVLTVTESDSGLGLSIVISHGRYTTVYGHLDEVNVAPGDYVDSTTVIALSGNSGWSTGPHLHFELYESGLLLDPLKALPA